MEQLARGALTCLLVFLTLPSAMIAAADTSPPARTPAAASPMIHQRVVFQVSEADPKTWNLALNNIRNVQADLGKDKVEIELVAYGPGIAMLKFDSPVAGILHDVIGSGVRVVACENTMTNQHLRRSDMAPDIQYVKAGVVELMQRQKEGWAYIRP